ARDASFIVAGMRALEHFGDSQALLYIRRFATIPANSEVERWVRDAALECIPELEALAAKEQTAQTLLRAADAPDSPESILLRPTSGASDPDDRQLLRPSEPGE